MIKDFVQGGKNLKEKIITIVMLILLFCGACTICYATETGTVYLDSNYDVVEKGDEIEITVNLKDSETAAFNLFLYFDETKWEYVSEIDNTNVDNNRVLFVWYDVNGGESAKQGELVKFKFKAKENGLSTFNIEGEFYNASGQLIKTDFKEKQVQIGKKSVSLISQHEEEKGINEQVSNANLQALRLDIEGLSPSFNKDTYEYYLTVSNNIKTIDVLVVSENPNATIDVIGNTDLKEGLNTIKVKVTSEDKNETKIYSIYVTKTADIEAANTNLEILAIENALLSPPFDANETIYKTEVSKDTEKLNVFAVPENENAKVQISGTDNLKEGDNLINVVVTAANGFSTKKYQVEVHRRNEEEQIKYEEEQKQQAEKVEQAYEIEKLSNEHEENINEKNNNKGNIAIWCVVIAVVILIVVALIIWYFRNRKIKNKR